MTWSGFQLFYEVIEREFSLNIIAKEEAAGSLGGIGAGSCTSPPTPAIGSVLWVSGNEAL